MSFAINTNNDALNTYRNLTNVQNSLSKSLERLSSGLRINQAGDDAAGLTIATQIGSQVSGLQQAARNAQDGTSLLQTADGALTQVQSLLGNLRDLAVQAANDSNSGTARTAIQTQATSIVSEIQRLGQSVNFNGINLLDGSAGTSGTLTFQVGANGDSQSRVGVDLSGANLSTVVTALNGTSTTGKAFAIGSSGLNQASVKISDGTSAHDVTVDLSGASTVAAQVTALNGASGFSTYFTASASSDGTKVTIALKGSGTLAVSAGADSTHLSTLSGTTDTISSGGVSFSSATAAQTAIGTIQDQLDAVSRARAAIGAGENRFASAQSTISTAITNLTAAKSRITDVDMAQEMVNYTRANVLSQSGTAMLAQANSLPQLALKLLS